MLKALSYASCRFHKVLPSAVTRSRFHKVLPSAVTRKESPMPCVQLYNSLQGFNRPNHNSNLSGRVFFCSNVDAAGKSSPGAAEVADESKSIPDDYFTENVAVVGEKVPNFNAEAVNHRNKTVQVDLYENYFNKEKNYVILFFYPNDFPPKTAKELRALNKRYGEFRELGAVILGISVDSVSAHVDWKNNKTSTGLGDLDFLLVSDITKSISKSYNILIPDGKVGQGTAMNGTFITDKKGILQNSLIFDLNFSRGVDETLSALKEIKQRIEEAEAEGLKAE